MKRQDDYLQRRKKIASLSGDDLYKYFWELTGKVVDPLLELGRTNTSPSIERSVLLRMGISSIDAKVIVDGCIGKGLIGHGAGHVVYKLAKIKKIPVKDASLLLVSGGKIWDEAVSLFK
ncbi:ornithine aminomutase [Spirochaetia bacterium]|nr:ornithine aminomutase [Spirochaetia bacterium]